MDPSPYSITVSLQRRSELSHLFLPHAVTKHTSVAGALRLRGSRQFPVNDQSMLDAAFHMFSLRTAALPEMSNFYCHPGRAGGSLLFG
jgi:hypothetical protein